MLVSEESIIKPTWTTQNPLSFVLGDIGPTPITSPTITANSSPDSFMSVHNFVENIRPNNYTTYNPTVVSQPTTQVSGEHSGDSSLNSQNISPTEQQSYDQNQNQNQNQTQHPYRYHDQQSSMQEHHHFNGYFSTVSNNGFLPLQNSTSVNFANMQQFGNSNHVSNSQIQGDYFINTDSSKSLSLSKSSPKKALRPRHLRQSSSNTQSPEVEYTKTRRPKIQTVQWDEEGTLCYQVKANNVLVSRREDDDYINGTKLLNATSMTRGKRDGILKNEKSKEGKVVKVGSMSLKGIWIPFERALELARNEGVDKLLHPLFVKDLKTFFNKQGGKDLENSDEEGDSNEDEAKSSSYDVANDDPHDDELSTTGFESNYPDQHGLNSLNQRGLNSSDFKTNMLMLFPNDSYVVDHTGN